MGDLPRVGVSDATEAMTYVPENRTMLRSSLGEGILVLVAQITYIAIVLSG